MAKQFPMPFGGIIHSVTVPSYDAERVLVAIIAEQETKGHFHNFAVEVDNPRGITIYGTTSLMSCIEETLS